MDNDGHKQQWKYFICGSLATEPVALERKTRRLHYICCLTMQKHGKERLEDYSTSVA